MTEAWKSTAVGWLSHDQRLLLAVLRAVSHAEAIETVTIATDDLLAKPLLKPWTVQGFEGAAEGLERHGHEVAAWAYRMLTVKAGDYPDAVTALTAEACHLAGRVQMIWVEVSAKCRVWDAIAEGRILVSGIDLFAAVERVRLAEMQQLRDATIEKETQAMHDDIWIADFACAPNAREAAEILVEATVAATNDNSFESFPVEDESPGVRVVADRFAMSLKESHPSHAMAWQAWAAVGGELHHLAAYADALTEIIRSSKLPGIPRAQAVAHMRLWRKLSTHEDGHVGGGISFEVFRFAKTNFRAEMARVEEDDPLVRKAFRAPVNLLCADDRNEAVQAMKKATLAQLHPNDGPLVITPEIHNSDFRAARKRIDAIVELLFDGGTEDAGELAIGWQMLAAWPGNPSSMHTFMPQLQRLVDRTFMSARQRAFTQARLNIWWSAAAGNFENGKLGLFQLAKRETADMNDEKTAGFEASRKSAVDRDPEFEVPAGPSLVVMPKATSTKLDSSHSVHGAFKQLVDLPLPLIVAQDVAAIRRQLHREYPHAVTAIDLVLRDLREGKPVTLKPFLLVGGPGAGKSRLVRRLGELLGLFVFRYDGAAAMDGMFGGISKGWTSSQPSAPARAVEQAKHANPIVMVDEIEKGSESTRNGSLWNAMMPFLEPETAARFRDPSLDAELDLSRVTFAATANDDTPLPSPLKDRFRIIRVPDPTLAHLPALAANVMRELTAADDSRMHDEPLALDELQVIGRAWQRSGLSMRKLQKIVGATLEARDAYSMRH